MANLGFQVLEAQTIILAAVWRCVADTTFRRGNVSTLQRQLSEESSNIMSENWRTGNWNRGICIKVSGVIEGDFPVLPFLVFFLEKGRENHQKKRIFYPYRTPKNLGKEAKNGRKNKEILARRKNKEFQKNKERKDRVSTSLIRGVWVVSFWSRESFQGSRTESLFFCESRFGALNIANHVWGNSRESLKRYENRTSLRIDSRESIHANGPDSRCESPGHL